MPSALQQSVGLMKQSWAREQGIKWQQGFFDHRIRSHAHLLEKIHYVRMNPVRAGLVATPEAWPYTWGPVVD